MDFKELAQKRYSCRSYKPDKVKREDLLTILESGRVCPTANNNQPYKLIVVQKEENLEKVKKSGKIFNAPLMIIVCGDTATAWKSPFDGSQSTEIDAAIITDHMMLQATDLGLDTLWICKFDHAVIKSEFHIPEHLEPINILLIGYGDGEPKSPQRHGVMRKAMEEIVCHESL